MRSGDFKVSGQALYGDILALVKVYLFGQHVRKRHSLSVYTFIVYGISAPVFGVLPVWASRLFFAPAC
ncbi:hypothetical protein P4282_02630 [Bacillus swezeyi]|nr:hypothetical protein [Bacillus swezeyi]